MIKASFLHRSPYADTAVRVFMREHKPNKWEAKYKCGTYDCMTWVEAVNLNDAMERVTMAVENRLREINNRTRSNIVQVETSTLAKFTNSRTLSVVYFYSSEEDAVHRLMMSRLRKAAEKHSDVAFGYMEAGLMESYRRTVCFGIQKLPALVFFVRGARVNLRQGEATTLPKIYSLLQESRKIEDGFSSKESCRPKTWRSSRTTSSIR